MAMWGERRAFALLACHDSKAKLTLDDLKRELCQVVRRGVMIMKSSAFLGLLTLLVLWPTALAKSERGI